MYITDIDITASSFSGPGVVPTQLVFSLATLIICVYNSWSMLPCFSPFLHTAGNFQFSSLFFLLLPHSHFSHHLFSGSGTLLPAPSSWPPAPGPLPLAPETPGLWVYGPMGPWVSGPSGPPACLSPAPSSSHMSACHTPFSCLPVWSIWHYLIHAALTPLCSYSILIYLFVERNWTSYALHYSSAGENVDRNLHCILIPKVCEHSITYVRSCIQV